MEQQEYITRLENENKELKKRLGKINKQKQKSNKIKKGLIGLLSVPLFGVPLKKSISNAIHEYKERKSVSVDTVSDVTSNVIWRVTRIGLFAILMAVIPSLVLLYQTKLLYNQNAMIKSQNSLIEADRRSSLVTVMGDVLSDVNQELKNKASGERSISRTLEARIVSLSMAMKPYQFKENDQLIEKPISPEKGQLLFALLRSQIGKQSSRDIFLTGDFNYTSLKNANLGRGALLQFARLNHSDFSGSEIVEGNLKRVELKEANLTGTFLSESDLSQANLYKADMKKAELIGVNFTNANLFGVDLTGANLSEATLWGTKLKKANLTAVKLDNAIVHREDWIAYVSDSLDLDGGSDIRKNYRLKKQGKKQFLIVAK
ncbi:pentapeptide repeat-containing protein [Aquimarina sp. TRL1]|uniref:pentapeptide repeat-containing protein n=1 Tax=Aquimarina sp. (strain TRL1) TaxID=2736252 RepID=UPI00158AA816|nr:pentapeptide repeat-containing protein [Aquimarina sp. TRL1]QKX05244.1 pentapeptide repeat-containing protein [Aquimarina sp. TRL1]